MARKRGIILIALSLVMGVLLYTTSITRLEMKRFRYLDTPRSPPA